MNRVIYFHTICTPITVLNDTKSASDVNDTARAPRSYLIVLLLCAAHSIFGHILLKVRYTGFATPIHNGVLVYCAQAAQNTGHVCKYFR